MRSESIALRIAAYFEQADYLKNKGVSTVIGLNETGFEKLDLWRWPAERAGIQDPIDLP